MKKTLTLLLVCCLLLGCLAGAAYADEPKQISYWIDVQQGSSMINSFAELACWQQVEKNLGVQIKWEHPAIGQGTEQFNLIMASSDLPDIMYYTWTDSYPGGPEAAIADGKIIALNDYIDEYAPNLKAYLEAHDDIRRVLHVTIPGILPTIIIMFILRVGQFMSVGYEKILLLYSPSIYDTADVISTFVYRKGLVESNFSFSAAVGLFNSVVNFALVFSVNKFSAKMSETSLW